MALSSQFSSEFVERIKAVTITPDDYYIKAETLDLIKPMKALAKSGDAMAQYRLAHGYLKNSPPYLTWLQASAKQGFTNAMLTLSLDLAESGKASNLQQAAKYLIQIFASDDTYIKDEATELLKRNHLLNAEFNRQMTSASVSVGKSKVGFFSPEESVAEKEPVVEEQNRCRIL